jgi:hypothetical protein
MPLLDRFHPPFKLVEQAIKELGVNPEKVDPLRA